jgi:(p)ppGpp synthase/HD superfamily hydrolase
MMNLLKKAKDFATIAHEGQVRKSTGLPMIGHPIRVAATLEKAGFDIATVAGGFLHDVVEDTKYTMEDIINEFGEEVAFVVAGNTEDKSKSWEERKQHTIDSIKNARLNIKALIVADKLDNLNALIEDYEKLGESLWKDFNRGKEKQKWYFTGVAENCMYGLKEEEIPEFFYEYIEKVKQFFK